MPLLLPYITRPDTGTLLVDSAYAGDRRRRRETAQAIGEEWTGAGWPDGLLAASGERRHSCAGPMLNAAARSAALVLTALTTLPPGDSSGR